MIEPLDLQTIFVNYFAGSMDIFFFIALIFFAYLAARFRMPNSIFLVMMGLFVVLMAGLGYDLFYVLVIFIVAWFFYHVISKPLKQ